MKILVVDVGGTNVKVRLQGEDEVHKIPSGPDLTPGRMAEAVRGLTGGWDYDAVSVGYPGPVRDGKVAQEPVNLGKGWVGFDFAAALGRPVRLLNDAAMQALGSYQGGCMLFLGLGTGLGSALIVDNVVAPMELAHLPYRKKRSFEEYVGAAGLQRLGRKKWEAVVADVVARLKKALLADYVVLGGGNAKKLRVLPPDCRLGANSNAYVGGIRLWEGGRSPAPGGQSAVGDQQAAPR